MELLSSCSDPATEIMILFNLPKTKKRKYAVKKITKYNKGSTKGQFRTLYLQLKTHGLITIGGLEYFFMVIFYI